MNGFSHANSPVMLMMTSIVSCFSRSNSCRSRTTPVSRSTLNTGPDMLYRMCPPSGSAPISHTDIKWQEKKKTWNKNNRNKWVWLNEKNDMIYIKLNIASKWVLFLSLSLARSRTVHKIVAHCAPLSIRVCVVVDCERTQSCCCTDKFISLCMRMTTSR